MKKDRIEEALTEYIEWKAEARRREEQGYDPSNLYCCARCDYYKRLDEFSEADTKLGHMTICRACVKQDKLDEKERRTQEMKDWWDAERAGLEDARRAVDADTQSVD